MIPSETIPLPTLLVALERDPSDGSRLKAWLIYLGRHLDALEIKLTKRSDLKRVLHPNQRALEVTIGKVMSDVLKKTGVDELLVKQCFHCSLEDFEMTACPKCKTAFCSETCLDARKTAHDCDKHRDGTACVASNLLTSRLQRCFPI